MGPTPLVHCGGEVNASTQIAAMVYTLNAPSAVQGHIAGIGPGFAPSSHQGGAVPIPTLATKAFCLYIAQRQHDVGVGVAGLCVQRNVRDHAQTHKVLVHVPVKERNVLRMGQFDGECNLDLAGQLTVGPCLDGFDLIPQLWAVKNPSGGTARRQDCAVCHLAFAGAVEHKPRAGTIEPHTCPIGRCGDRVTAVAARDDLYCKMKYRHRPSFADDQAKVVAMALRVSAIGGTSSCSGCFQGPAWRTQTEFV